MNRIEHNKIINLQCMLQALREADDAICERMAKLPTTPEDRELYAVSLKQRFVHRLNAILGSGTVYEYEVEIAFREEVYRIADGDASDHTTLHARAHVHPSIVADGTMYAEIRCGYKIRPTQKLHLSETAVLPEPITVVSEKKVGLIDGLTPDECLARFTMMQREMPCGDIADSKTYLTSLQLIAAKALWAHDVRVAVKKTEAADKQRAYNRVIVDDVDEL